VVGEFVALDGRTAQAFSWRKGQPTWLGDLAGHGSEAPAANDTNAALAVNASGWIVVQRHDAGAGRRAASGERRAILAPSPFDLLAPMSRSTPTDADVVPLRRGGHEDAVGVAMDWLVQRHRKGWRSAFEELLDHLRPDAADDDWQLDDDLMQMLTVNAGEWLLARGEIRVGGGHRPINDYLLGREGPYLTPPQRAWIAQLGQQALKLYRVTDVRLDEGMTLVDALDATAEPVVVRERSGSRSARPGQLLGVRLMQVGDHRQLSGAIYGFAKLREPAVMEAVEAALQAPFHADNVRLLAELAIARQWLAQWTEPMPMPELRDAASGEAVLLVTDHYRVADAAALAAALASQPDVTGDAEAGWHRNVDAGGDMTRSLAAINPGRAADRIEVFYRTQRMADEGRAWFEALAGASVQHLTREMTDPRSAAALAGAARRPEPTPELDPETLTAVMEQVMKRSYAHWADEPIPVLGNQTPRQAIGTSAGLERVKGLLREYEAGEADMARRDGRSEVSFRFLWEELGIER